MSEFQSLEQEVSFLIDRIQPTKQSNDLRRRVFEYFTKVTRSTGDDLLLLPSGSSFSRTYLPDGDLDLIVAPSKLESQQQSQQHHLILTKLFIALSNEAEKKEASPDFTIRNIEFINARTKLLHCRINNLGVDISFHQISAVYSLHFLEQVNQIVGKKNLFKRSLLLIKTWCLNESLNYSGGPIILGSKEGMFSSYAVSVLVMYLFNKFGKEFNHPLQVLHLFLHFYQMYPWETHVLTLEGPKFIQNSSVSTSTLAQMQAGREFEKQFACENKFLVAEEFVSNTFNNSPLYLLKHRSVQLPNEKSDGIGQKELLGMFPLRACNIQDPIDRMNNIGSSIPRSNLPVISRSLMIGYQAMEAVFYRYQQMKHVNRMNDRMGQAFCLNTIPPPSHTLSPLPHSHTLPEKDKSISNPVIPPPDIRAFTFPVIPLPVQVPQFLPPHSQPNFYLPVPQNPPQLPDAPIPNRHSKGRPDSRSPSVECDSTSGTSPSSSSAPLCGERSTSNNGAEVSDSERSRVAPSPFMFELFPNSLRRYVLSGNLRSDLLDHPLQFIPHASTTAVLPQEELDAALRGETDLALKIILSESEQVEPSEEKLVEEAFTANHSKKDGETNQKVAESSLTPSRSALQPIDRSFIEADPHPTPRSTDARKSPELEAEQVPKTNKSKAKRKKGQHSVGPLNPTDLDSKDIVREYERVAPLTETKIKIKSDSADREDRTRPLVEEFCNYAEKQLRNYYYPLIICFAVFTITALLLRFELHLQLNPLTFPINAAFNSIPRNESDAPLSSSRGINNVVSENSVLDGFIHNLIELSRPSPTLADGAADKQWNVVDESQTGGKQSASEPVAPLVPAISPQLATHWVQVGDSITFGDFSLFVDYLETGNYPISTMQYLWTKDNRNISTTIQPFFSIEESTFEDGGHYRCFKLLSSHQSVLLTESIIRISKRPRIRNRPFYHEAKLGKTLVLNLDVEGVPPPNFRWFRNGYLLPDQIQRSLMIDNVERGHSGTYSCEVSNIAGKFVWLEATVSVLD